MTARYWGALVCIAVGAMACGSGSEEPATTETFIALQKDFVNFQSWRRFELGVDGNDGVHVTGSRVTYLNRTPPHGSTSFPVGTILVKTVGEGTPAQGNTFAMVKRGGGYNSQGAAGWEWFELKPGTGGTPLIVWRGIAPPVGEGYAGAVMGGSCNGCHQSMSADNDGVPNAMLRLSGF